MPVIMLPAVVTSLYFHLAPLVLACQATALSGFGFLLVRYLRLFLLLATASALTIFVVE